MAGGDGSTIPDRNTRFNRSNCYPNVCICARTIQGPYIQNFEMKVDPLVIKVYEDKTRSGDTHCFVRSLHSNINVCES